VQLSRVVAMRKVISLVMYWEEMQPKVFVMKMISILEHQKILLPRLEENLGISPVLLENLHLVKLGNAVSHFG
jgi:hypothetical protein